MLHRVQHCVGATLICSFIFVVRLVGDCNTKSFVFCPNETPREMMRTPLPARLSLSLHCGGKKTSWRKEMLTTSTAWLGWGLFRHWFCLLSLVPMRCGTIDSRPPSHHFEMKRSGTKRQCEPCRIFFVTWHLRVMLFPSSEGVDFKDELDHGLRYIHCSHTAELKRPRNAVKNYKVCVRLSSALISQSHCGRCLSGGQL